MVTLGGNILWMPVRRPFRMSSMRALKEMVKWLSVLLISYLDLICWSHDRLVTKVTGCLIASSSVYILVYSTTVFKSPASYLMGTRGLFIWE
jgi:hypothetical protein